jgi:hypothetical protein
VTIRLGSARKLAQLTEREIELAGRGVEDLLGPPTRGQAWPDPRRWLAPAVAMPVASSSPIVGSAMLMIVTRDNRTLHTPASRI